MFGGIFVVNTINFGGFHDNICVDFGSPKGCRRVGGEERVAGTGSKNHHPTLFHVANRPAADIGLRNFLHRNGTLDPRRYPGPFKAILQGDGIHHRRQHADVIGGGTVHAGGRSLEAAKNVAAAHNDGQLGAIGHNGGDIAGDGLDDGGIDPVTLIPHQRFAAQLEKHTPVSHRSPPSH